MPQLHFVLSFESNARCVSVLIKLSKHKHQTVSMNSHQPLIWSLNQYHIRLISMSSFKNMPFITLFVPPVMAVVVCDLLGTPYGLDWLVHPRRSCLPWGSSMPHKHASLASCLAIIYLTDLLSPRLIEVVLARMSSCSRSSHHRLILRYNSVQVTPSFWVFLSNEVFTVTAG